MAEYEFVLTAGALEAIREMQDGEKQLLTVALRAEFPEQVGAPAPTWVPTGSPVDYPARALASGHVVVYRLLDETELKTLARQRHTSVASAGVAIFDILSRPGPGRRR
jgi:hypothetical protein